MGHSCRCLTLFTLSRRHVPSRKVETTLCIKDVGHDKRGNYGFISTMGDSGYLHTIAAQVHISLRANLSSRNTHI
jgi:hypothetical protein